MHNAYDSLIYCMFSGHSTLFRYREEGDLISQEGVCWDRNNPFFFHRILAHEFQGKITDEELTLRASRNPKQARILRRQLLLLLLLYKMVR